MHMGQGSASQIIPRHPTTQLPNYPITQLPNYPITQLPNYPITQLPNYPTTQLPNYPTTQLFCCIPLNNFSTIVGLALCHEPVLQPLV